MQTQDAPAEIMFKFWPWFEANRKRLLIVGAVAVVGFFGWFFVSTQNQQNELAAGQAYTQFQLSQPPTAAARQVSDGYLAIATKYPGTEAAQRAWLQSATVLFQAGSYADAQVRFQNFLAADSGSSLAPLAHMGVAASLEAQGKLDGALTAYRTAATAAPGSAEAMAAKFSQGRVLELQGKLTEAVELYKDVEGSPLAGSLASDAAQRVALLQAKLAAAQPAKK
jgi:predicted negative regulator of RcsB-dependent stress response